MMNQYYGFSGRGGRFDYDRAPYRRPGNRGNMPGCMSNRAFGTTQNNGVCPGGNSHISGRSGCGCGMNRAQNHHHDHDHNHDHAIPAMDSVRECGCGCGNSTDSASCKRLMDQIRAVDFALYETVLYLDVYPHSCDALETYNKLKAQSEALHAEYEASCAPMTAFSNKSNTSWDWMSKPFPWEYDAD